MYTRGQGGRLGAADGRRRLGVAQARVVELGLDLPHALLQSLPIRTDHRHRDRPRMVDIVVARGVLPVGGPVPPVASPLCQFGQDPVRECCDPAEHIADERQDGVLLDPYCIV